jgi:flagellar basal body P-ring formation protein FlgA
MSSCISRRTSKLIEISILGSFLMASLVLADGAFAQPAAVAATRIELRPKASVSCARVYLSDVAKCIGSPDLCREATGIDVAGSPAPGRTVYLQKSMIEAVLEKEWPNASFALDGVDSIRIEAAGVEVSPDDIRTRLQEVVSERTTSINSEIRVTIHRVQPLGFVSVRPTQSRFNFSDLDSMQLQNVDWVSKNLVGTRMVQVRVENPVDQDDRSIIQVQVAFSVDRQLPVLKQAVGSGQLLTESNVVVAWVPMARGNQDFVLSADGIIGRKSRQSLSSGEPVPARYLESPLAVMRNQPVTMIVRTGGVEISARATTVDQGVVGQTVEVMNLATKKRMRARVIDEKTVEAVTF